MCDFHSVIVSTDGRLFHLPENSHSGIASHYGLKNLPESRQFYECEWDGRGEMPLHLVRDRAYGADRDIPALVQRVAESHYVKLARVLSGELDWRETSPFNLPEFSDVPAEIERHKQWLIDNAARLEREAIEAERRRIEAEERAAREAEAEALADKVVAQFGSEFDSLTADQIGVLIRQLTDAANGEAEEIFADLIEEKCEEAREEGHDSGYEDGREQGYQDAAEDMYSHEYVTDNIENFIDRDEWIRREDAAEHCEDEITEAREAGFLEGFAACKTGATPAPDFINGLPSFLFK